MRVSKSDPGLQSTSQPHLEPPPCRLVTLSSGWGLRIGAEAGKPHVVGDLSTGRRRGQTQTCRV